jgi:hypothetical protein
MRRFPLLVLAACNPAAAPGLSGPSPSAPAPMHATAAPVALDAALEPLRPLLGAWEGSDLNLHATGRFTLDADLGGKVLVRRNRTDSPQGHHDDLMIVFAAPTGLRASYFDGEGHVIQYAVTATADRIELVSDEAAGQPRFRLRYDRHGADDFAVEFSIAMPGAPDFKLYTGGAVHRAR